MKNIKKQYEDIHSFLIENKGKKVSTILEELENMMASKKGVSDTLRLNEAGELTHVFCYYHKEWEAIADVDYGKKASTKSGLNTMCKKGVSNWTKQQKFMKLAETKLLNKVASQEIEASEIGKYKELIKENGAKIIPIDVLEIDSDMYITGIEILFN